MDRQVIYTDGSCLNNGLVNAKAGAGIYFGKDDPRNTSCTVPGDQTNNRGELWAIIQALKIESGDVEICSDSQWAIKCALKEWEATKNLDLLSILWDMLKTRNVKFTWVKGHAKNIGNEAADLLAKEALKIIT